MSPFPRHDLLGALLSGIPAFVFTLRPGKFGLLSVTNGVKVLTGFEARDLLANPGLFVSRLFPDGREDLERLCADVAEGGGRVGGFRFANDAPDLFFGWTRTEMVGSTLHRLFPVPPEAVDAMVRTVRSGKTVSQETRLNTKSGGEADCRVTVSRVTGEGGVPAGMGVSLPG